MTGHQITILNQIVRRCHRLSKDAGWWERADIDAVTPTKIALIHSEISEALEGFRKDTMDDHLPHRKKAEVELADSIIRTFDLAGAHGFDLGAAIAEKLVYNQHRKDHTREVRGGPGGKKY